MHRKFMTFVALLGLALSCQSCAGEPAGTPKAGPPASVPAPAAQPANAILICWDGVDRSVLKELLKDGKLPHLATVIKAGSLQDIDVKGHQTETRPGHAEMFTGLSAEVNGIPSNHEGESVPEGTTIFEILKKHLGKDRISTAMITGKAYVGTVVSPKGREGIDTCDVGSRLANVVGPLCLAALEKHKKQRFFAFFHFLDPDSAGHSSGSDSQEYRQAAVACDAWLGAINDFLKKEKLAESTLIYVMADHGFDKAARMHSNAPDSWLATNDKEVTRGGIIADVPATILARFGVELEKLEPKLLGKPLSGKPAPADSQKHPSPVPEGAMAP